MNICDVANSFRIKGSAVSVSPYGFGHMNDTYLVVTDENAKYILQRINDKVFPDVDALMRNIVSVTNFLAFHAEDGEETLSVISTKNGDAYFQNEDGYFRTYKFISGGISVNSSATPLEFFLSGVGFGRFQKLLNGFPAEKLTEPIKNFHNTSVRFNQFKEAIFADKANRLSGVKPEVEFYLSRQNYCSRITNLLESGEMPLRVTHNDTKLNNVLIDAEHGKAVAVIDLDTVMPGSIAYDFGDSIRFGANTGAEDETNLAKVNFSLDLFRAFCKGFLGEVGNALNDTEINNLAFGAILMTYECGMRFLTDYLNGDIYFRVARESHNLDRTRTQIKMIEGMENNLSEMNAIVKEYAR